MIEHLFEVLILNPTCHQHNIEKEVFYELMTLCRNLVRVEDDFCQDKILEIKIFQVIFTMIEDCRYGSYMTQQGLDTINELMECYEAFEMKRA